MNIEVFIGILSGLLIGYHSTSSSLFQILNEASFTYWHLLEDLRRQQEY